MVQQGIGTPHDRSATARQASRRGKVTPRWTEYAFLVGRALDEDTLREAIALSERWNATPHGVLFAHGWVSQADYVAALAGALGTGALGRSGQGDAPRPRAVLVDAVSAPPSQVALIVAQHRWRGFEVALATREQLDRLESADSTDFRSQRAVRRLLDWRPVLSAGTPVWSWQVLAFTIGSGLLLGSLATAPEAAELIVLMVFPIAFLPVVLLRAAIPLIALAPRPLARPTRRVGEAELPVYSVLVPLFHETQVVSDLVRALSDLDYPAAKLDVLLVLESVDAATRREVERLDLPGFMRVIVVPDSRPRTKPKALNYALQFARGAYVVVYDAEDVPEADQLRRAVAAFREAGDDIFCLQARLNVHNPKDGWLARQFALEYSALFDVTLPALVRLGFPVPLGGTSNHFPRGVLERWQGWDPFNVTEDADLGVRLARAQGAIRMLDSTTWEEAPVGMGVWFRQRTRWLKGWMQTYLVHTRRPARLWRELGPAAFFGFHVYSGGMLLSALVFPWFCAAAAMQVRAGGLLAPSRSALEEAVLLLACFDLVVAGIAVGITAAVAVWRRGRAWLVPSIALMPLYWLLISLAAYRALVQLMVAPYHWEKTEHRPRSPAIPP